jgi:hypothetical protein
LLFEVLTAAGVGTMVRPDATRERDTAGTTTTPATRRGAR